MGTGLDRLWRFSLGTLGLLGTIAVLNFFFLDQLISGAQKARDLGHNTLQVSTLAQKASQGLIVYVQSNDQATRDAEAIQLRQTLTILEKTATDLVQGFDAMNFDVARVPAEVQAFMSREGGLDSQIGDLAQRITVLLDQGWTPDMHAHPALSELSIFVGTALTADLNTLDAFFRKEAADRDTTLRAMTITIVAIVLLVLMILTFYLLRPLYKELKKQNGELSQLAQTDPLTGCHNRRSFMTLANAEFQRQIRYPEPVTVLMLDIDHFKQVNDTYGHAAGDDVIRHTAEVCIDRIRNTDFLGRMGGEEFAIILPNTDMPNGTRVAKELVHALEHSKCMAGKPPTPISFTVSCGVGHCEKDDSTIFDALNRADVALLAAKRAGRNRVICSNDPIIAAAQIEAAE